MRLSRRLATVTAVLALALATAGIAGSAEAKPRPPKELNLQVLSFNDFHGYLQPPDGADATLGPTLDPDETEVGGAEYLASTLESLRAEARYSHTVAAGDLIGGTHFLSGLFHDEPAVESLNAMGLDVSSVGNHEFDEGVDELLRMQRGGCHPEDGCYEPWGEDAGCLVVDTGRALDLVVDEVERHIHERRALRALPALRPALNTEPQDGAAVEAARSALTRRWRSTVVPADDDAWVVRTWTSTPPHDTRPTGSPDVVHRVAERRGKLVVEQVHPAG